MTNFLPDSPNQRFSPRAIKTAVLVGAVATVTAIGVSQAFSSALPEGYLTCKGAQPFTPKPGDTLTGALTQTGVVDTATDARNVAISLAQRPEGLKGPLPNKFQVLRWAAGSPEPGLTADEPVVLPLKCTPNR